MQPQLKEKLAISFINLLVRAILLLLVLSVASARAEPLPSWNDSPAKADIIKFVGRVTQKDSANFVKPQDRVAVFDNDGTLWVEQPMYFQLAFAVDRVRVLAPQHPEWRKQQPFAAYLKVDHKAMEEQGAEGLERIFIATNSGMTTDEFDKSAAAWLKTARHPKFHRPYTELVYQPMIELLAYLRDNGFKTYIVSGGTSQFIRSFADNVYGIPPEQVIGSTMETKFEMQGNGEPALMILPRFAFVDDGPAKPVAIQSAIGKRPIFAFGNSDGDLQMLQWTAAGDGPRFMGLVHHTDAEREFAYDRDSDFGKLDSALSVASAQNWTVVDMKLDWRSIFPAGSGLTAATKPN